MPAIPPPLHPAAASPKGPIQSAGAGPSAAAPRVPLARRAGSFRLAAFFAVLALCWLASAPAWAQSATPSAPTPLHPALAIAAHRGTIYIGPDRSSAVVGTVQPGQNVVIQRLAHGYAQVFAGQNGTGRSGWMLNQGLVLLSAPHAAEILFGAAADLQQRAEQYSGEQAAAKNAARLYYRVYERFPQSFRAAEALYRAADITWQLDMADLPTTGNNADYRLPSTRLLREVIEKFPKTPWAARADYLHVREQMTCGDWAAKPKCLGKEIGRLRDYWKKYPDGPLAPEAAYGILYREAAGVHLYSLPGPHHNAGKAQDYERQAFNGIADLQRRWPRSDWAARAALIAYDLRQRIPVGTHRMEHPQVSPQ